MIGCYLNELNSAGDWLLSLNELNSAGDRLLSLNKLAVSELNPLAKYV